MQDCQHNATHSVKSVYTYINTDYYYYLFDYVCVRERVHVSVCLSVYTHSKTNFKRTFIIMIGRCSCFCWERGVCETWN